MSRHIALLQHKVLMLNTHTGYGSKMFKDTRSEVPYKRQGTFTMC